MSSPTYRKEQPFVALPASLQMPWLVDTNVPTWERPPAVFWRERISSWWFQPIWMFPKMVWYPITMGCPNHFGVFLGGTTILGNTYLRNTRQIRESSPGRGEK